MNVCYIDECGMASIAGPVQCCVIVLPSNTKPIQGVKDSKQLTKKKREELYETLKTLPHAFGTASPKSIEILNIFHARFLAMRRALNKMKDYNITKVIVDGKFEIPDIDIPQEAIIKADEKLWEVGAASILAKVKRDGVMTELAKIDKYKPYDWPSNAGYFSPNHRLGIIEHGPTHLHRVNFAYFKYCLFCHNKYKEMGENLEKYLEYEQQEKIKYGKSHYQLWKNGQYDSWKEIKYGERD